MPEFGRPLGAFLQGGGSLGAWQAGALEVLDAAGLRFDAVMGYSIGAVNGAALAFGRLAVALARWREAGAHSLKLRPRLRPLALCAPEPLSELLTEARDEEGAKRALGAELTVVSSCPADGAPVYARFTPGARAGWDAPLLAHAEASCAIPLVFPPVELDYRGGRKALIDGGVPMPTPLDLSPLASCADVIVLEMVRADEVGRRFWTPWRRLDQGGREAGRGLVDEGVAGLLRGERPPRVFRLQPSARLAPMMLDFRRAGLRRLLAQGAEDARAFLAAPERAR
ncbi:MAG: patatin-like phospholipase family protein, partial [Elusimicrobia bacterium]|nr:patatin-like phospholipase family protein [Elusimicrobiota bacterium]